MLYLKNNLSYNTQKITPAGNYVNSVLMNSRNLPSV